MRWSTIIILSLTIALITGGKGIADDVVVRRQQVQREIDVLNYQINNVQRQVRQFNDQYRDASNQQDRAKRDVQQQTKAYQEATRELESAETPLKTAKSNADKADVKLKDVTKKVREDLEKSPEIVQAVKEMEEAQSGQAAARATALSPLQNDSNFLAAVAAEKEAKNTIDKLRFAKAPDRDAISRAASDLLEKQKAVAALEQAALAANQPYQEADEKLSAALKVISDLRAGVREKVKDSPERLAVVKELDTAKATFVEAQGNYNAAQRKQNSARQAAMQAQERSQKLTDQINTSQREIRSYQQQLDGLYSQRERKVRELNSLR